MGTCVVDMSCLLATAVVKATTNCYCRYGIIQRSRLVSGAVYPAEVDLQINEMPESETKNASMKPPPRQGTVHLACE